MNHNLKKLVKYTTVSSALVAVEGNYDLEAPTTSPSHADVWRILNLETRLGHLFSLFTCTIVYG